METKKLTARETVALISMIGLLVTTLLTVFNPLYDMQRGAMKPLESYLRLAMVTILPFAVVFGICVLLGRRKVN